MPRKRNTYPTVLVKISTTPAIGKYLEELVATGLFGKTTPEVAERLVARGVEALLRDGILRSPDAEHQKAASKRTE